MIPRNVIEMRQGYLCNGKAYELAKRTDYISFNMDACKEFIRLCPKSEVSYLNGELSPMELKELGLQD